MRLGELELKAAAKEAVGNWQNFKCFVWWREREIKDSNKWAIIYTHHRDSGLIDESNAEVIRKEMDTFTEGDDPDVVFESQGL